LRCSPGSAAAACSARGPSYWDVAGALTFIGICVAQTIEPAELVTLIEGADRRP
jgi:hypothetical protein